MFEKYNVDNLFLAIITVTNIESKSKDKFIEKDDNYLIKNGIEEYEYFTILYKDYDKYIDLNHLKENNKKRVSIIEYKQRLEEYEVLEKRLISRRKALKLAKKHYDELKGDCLTYSN